MALNIYREADPSSAFSKDGTFSNPLSVALNGALGDVYEQRIYVRNDDVARNYADITITPIDGGDDIVDGSKGFSWKVLSGDQKPLEEQWDLQTAGAGVNVGNLTDTNTYLPFWIRVQVPKGADVTSYQGVKLEVEATES